MKKTLFITLLALLPFGLFAVPKSGEVKMHAGRPAIFINNVPMLPDIYALTHATGARWSWEEVPQHNIKQFYKIGFRIFQVDLWLQDLWFADRPDLDLDKARKQIRGVLDVAPDAAVIIRIHTNAPYWWNEANKEECTEFADGPVDETLKSGPPRNNEDFDTRRSLRASLASAKWKTEAGERIAELCDRLSKTPEGDAVAGMHVAGGIYGEWHYWGFVNHDPDTGPAMTRYFRDWLRKKYGTNKALQKAWNDARATFENATVPNVPEREAVQYGFFKDPKQERRTIDYFEAQQEVVAEDIEYFTALVKKQWPRPLIVGVFYGYLHMTFNRQTVGGHLLVERMLNCPHIDYFAAPQTYFKEARGLGGSGHSRGVVESTLLHGKLWLDEVDNGEQQRQAAADFVRYGTRYDPNYAPVIRRSALFPLMRGAGLWYYDFGIRESLGWWDDPKYLNAISEEKALLEKRMNIPYRSEADVLFVWSPDNCYYLKPGRIPVSSNVLDLSTEQAMRCGVVGDHIYDFDLDRINPDQYKAVIFMNNYVLTERQKKLIREKIAGNNRTLIFNYLSGLTDGNRLDLSFCEKMTGIKIEKMTSDEPQRVYYPKTESRYSFNDVVDPCVRIVDSKAEPLAYLDGTKTVVAARKTFSGHNVVFAALPVNETNVFRELFRQAGCHVYNEANDFTYVNTGLMMIHTKDGGKRDIKLKNGKTFGLDLPPKSTTVLDAVTGEIVLQ